MALRHNAKYFLDFVDFVLFRIPSVDSFTHHSLVLGPRIQAGEKQIDLTGSVSAREFEQLLEVLLPLQVTYKSNHSKERWYLVLKLANTWQIEPLRRCAIQKIGWEDTIEHITQGRRYHVAQWVELGYTSFVQRTAPPTAAEAERLGWPVALKICHLREELAQAKAEANVEAQGGAHRPPDVAKRITDVFADELGRIHDACSWLRAREAEGIVGLATIVNARALPPKPVRAVKPGVPNARSTGPHPYSFKLSALPAQRDIPSVFEGPPAQAAFSFGCSSGEVAQLVGGLVTPPEPLKIANASAAQQDNLPPPETPMLPAILTPPVSILLSLANARLARSLPVAAVEPKPESPGQHANLEPLPQAPEPSHSPNDTAQASPEAPVSPTTPHRSPPFSPLSEKTRAEAEDVRRRMAAFRISV
ncbi:hypothetical protein AB1N83_000518 [Pleurotus pulmonarius]